MQHEMMMNVLRDPLAQQLLHSEHVARLGYNGLDRAPRVIPIAYLWTGASFVMCTATTTPKVRSLAADPRVALTLDTDAPAPVSLLVRGTAGVEIVDGVPDEFFHAARKGIAREQWSDYEDRVRAVYPQMARVTVQPNWAKLLDFKTRFPSAVAELISARS